MADGRAYLPGAHVTAAEIRRRIAAAWPGTRVVADNRRRRAGAPVRRATSASRGTTAVAGRTRRFGIISPMTEHFCATCNRLRLSTAGALHACLAYDDAVDLRGPLHAGRAGRGRPGDTRRARRQTPRTHLPAHRARRTPQGDGTNRRMIDGARLKQRIADLAPAFEERLAALCGIPSVSMDPGRRAEMAACAKLGADYAARGGRAGRHRSTPAASRWSSAASSRIRRFRRSPSTTTWTCSRPTAEGWRTPPFKLTRDASGRRRSGALVRARLDRRQGAGADRALRRAAGDRERRARQHPVPLGAGGRDRQPPLRGRPGRRRRGRRRRPGARRWRPIRWSSRTRSGSRRASRRSRTACAG